MWSFGQSELEFWGFVFGFFVLRFSRETNGVKTVFLVLLGSEIFTVLLVGKKIIRKSELFYLSG